MSRLSQLKKQCQYSHSWTQSLSAQNWPTSLDAVLPAAMMEEAQSEILRWPDYTPTRLLELRPLAASINVASVQYKDESTRLGLGSFKALGGAYAVIHYLAEHLSQSLGKPISVGEIRAGTYGPQASQVTVASATDGNHGRSVAWGAQQAGCQCNIYIHSEVSQSRANSIAEFGAQVIRVDGDYDASLRACADESAEQGWQVISDTSYAGYMDIPRRVMAGYTVMVREILMQNPEPPTHVFIQAGVGGLAAAVCAAFWSACGMSTPRFIITESEMADCVLQSMQQGKPATVEVKSETIMAGLSCGEISLLAWEILSQCTSAVLTLPDDAVADTMRAMASGEIGGEAIEAGECATPGIIALLAACNDASLCSELQLDDQSRILVFGCEGATDPSIYAQIIGKQ